MSFWWNPIAIKSVFLWASNVENILTWKSQSLNTLLLKITWSDTNCVPINISVYTVLFIEQIISLNPSLKSALFDWKTQMKIATKNIDFILLKECKPLELQEKTEKNPIIHGWKLAPSLNVIGDWHTCNREKIMVINHDLESSALWCEMYGFSPVGVQTFW